MNPFDPIAFIREHARPLSPIPTDLCPRLDSPGRIRGVLFDLYGTVFVSGAGEIGSALDGTLAAELRHAIVRRHAAARQSGMDYPEVDIRDVWQEICPDANPEEAAMEYEWQVNPAWPMPGVVEVLPGLTSSGRALGIVSNAQFYTAPMFPALMGKTLDAMGFDPRACVWSFEEKQAKPARHLYEKAIRPWLRMGWDPGEILMVGNDMRNDILAAAECGLKTALFAGDARSLRLRDRDPADTPPDVILTDIRQLLTILSEEPL